MKQASKRKLWAIPPENYHGSVADWMVKLQERGLWDGEGWHGDALINEDDYWSILEECEKTIDQ